MSLNDAEKEKNVAKQKPTSALEFWFFISVFHKDLTLPIDLSESSSFNIVKHANSPLENKFSVCVAF